LKKQGQNGCIFCLGLKKEGMCCLSPKPGEASQPGGFLFAPGLRTWPERSIPFCQPSAALPEMRQPAPRQRSLLFTPHGFLKKLAPLSAHPG